MRRARKLRWFILLSLCGAIAAGSFLLDGAVSEFIRLFQSPGLRSAMVMMTRFGDLSSLLIAIACVYVLGVVSSHEGQRQTAIVAALALFTAGLSVLVFKLVAARGNNGDFYWLWGWNGQGMMFPSGHAAIVCAVAVVLGSVYRSLRWPLVLIVLAVAISRVYLYHFFSDVVAGLFLGWAVSSLVLRSRSVRSMSLR